MHRPHSPVDEAEQGVQHHEDDELLVQQLVDAAFPAEQQLGETPKTGVGDFQRVRDCHRSSALHLGGRILLSLPAG